MVSFWVAGGGFLVSLCWQVIAFEVIGDCDEEGASVLRGCDLFVLAADGWLCHGGFGIGSGFLEALALRLLRFAPLDVGHVGALDQVSVAFA